MRFGFSTSPFLPRSLGTDGREIPIPLPRDSCSIEVERDGIGRGTQSRVIRGRPSSQSRALVKDAPLEAVVHRLHSRGIFAPTVSQRWERMGDLAGREDWDQANS